ncbi:MAG TPA: CHAT domain-containing tetratricopeptide repeat protein, partial [Bacteroidales bacterium]|nr:CHAT domain-containing tetratricopeptide repeat protein [Bacteroidales bacterium]
TGLLMPFCSSASVESDNNLKKANSDIVLKARQLLEANRLDSALMLYRTALSDLISHGKWDSVVSVTVDIAEIKRQKRENDSAFYFLDHALMIYKSKNVHNNQLHADILHKKGVTSIDIGNYSDAELNLREAIYIRQLSGDQSSGSLALSFNGLGNIHLRRHLYDSAIWHYRKAMEIASAHIHTANLDIAMFYENIGIVHSSVGNFDSAYYYLGRSLEIHKKVLPPNDRRMGRIYLNTGRQLQLAGISDKAITFFDLAENVIESNEGPDHFLHGVIMLNKANIFTDLSDYNKALVYATQALNIFTKHYNAAHARVLLSYLTIGHIYEKREEYYKAIEYYLKGLSAERSHASDIKVLRNLAKCFFELGNKEQAESYFIKAIELSRAIYQVKHPEIALSYRHYAQFLATQKQFAKAFDMFETASNIFLNIFGAKNRDLSYVYLLTGHSFLEAGKTDEALNYFQKALMAIIPDFNSTDIFDNPTLDQLIPDQYLLNALYSKAMAMHLAHKSDTSQQLLNKSLETYMLAAELINRLRASYISQESKLIITAVASEIFPRALECALDLYFNTGQRVYLEKAFSFSESGRAALLHSALQEMEAREIAKVPAAVSEQERQLRRNLDSYNQLIHEERALLNPNVLKINNWEEMVFQLNRRYDSLVQAIDQLYPEFYELRFGSPLISLSEVQNALGNNDALISYTFGASKLFILGITSDSIVVHVVDSVDDLQNDLHLLRQHLVAPALEHFTLSRFKEFVSVSNRLYSSLLGDMEALISNRRLIIIPDHQLGYIPFEVLTTHYHESDVMDFRQLPYLVKRQPVSYAYSASLLIGGEPDGRRNSQKILAFAPDYKKMNYSSNEQRSELLPLPFALEEVKSITRLFRGRSFSRDLATERNFKHRASGYGVLHLAMHAFINNENPLYSRLVFGSSSDTIEDGMLHTYELFNLDLNAELAVLSACQTGDGRLHRGEGIMSLARGFFYAGVPSIVMTLWAVDDASSAAIVTSFYRFLFRAKTKDEALRQAKLEYLNNSNSLNSHPHFWAGFVNIGDTQPILLRRNHLHYLPYLLLAIAAVVAVIFVIVKRRH